MSRTQKRVTVVARKGVTGSLYKDNGPTTLQKLQVLRHSVESRYEEDSKKPVHMQKSSVPSKSSQKPNTIIRNQHCLPTPQKARCVQAPTPCLTGFSSVELQLIPLGLNLSEPPTGQWVTVFLLPCYTTVTLIKHFFHETSTHFW